MCISSPTPSESNGEGREPGLLKLCIGGVLFLVIPRFSPLVRSWAGHDLVKQLLAVILFR
jgi:hypothetical protein